MVFGRLSSDQELTSFRVAGVSLPRIAAPVFVVALVLSAISIWINVSVVPGAKAAMRTILYRELMRDPRSLLNPGIAEADFGKNTKIYVEGKDGDAILGLHMYQTRSEKDPASTPMGYVYAQRVEPPEVEEHEHRFKLILDNSFTEFANDDGSFDRLITGKTNAIRVTYVDTKPKIPKPAEMSNDELRKFAAENPQLNEKGRVAVRSEITRRYAFSMASLAFAFVGVPLGIKSRRRDTSSGLVLSILVGACYFLSAMVADQFHTDASVTTALWAPNVLCVLLGLWLFRRSRFK
jgi:lipopolysaccharide export LptBFGC system permease protein LptF